MCTDDYSALMRLLKESQIPFEKHEHEEVHTMEDCYRVQRLSENTVMPKNILLCNRQQTRFYLYVCSPFVSFRTAVFSKAMGISRVSFAADEHLARLLHVAPGALTPLALMFDKGREVQLCMDQALLSSEYLAFHPLVPTETLIFKRDVFLSRFLPLTEHTPVFVPPAGEIQDPV